MKPTVNKNFVVKNGLEVDTNTLFVDSPNNRVAIGTTVPTTTLDVRGKILSDSQVESFVGKFVGIVKQAGAVGVTTMTTLTQLFLDSRHLVCQTPHH